MSNSIAVCTDNKKLQKSFHRVAPKLNSRVELTIQLSFILISDMI